MTTQPPHNTPGHSQLFTVRLWREEHSNQQLALRGQVQHLLSGETRYFRDWATLVALLDTMFSTLTSKPKGDAQMAEQPPEYLVETDW